MKIRIGMKESIKIHKTDGLSYVFPEGLIEKQGVCLSYRIRYPGKNSPWGNVKTKSGKPEIMFRASREFKTLYFNIMTIDEIKEFFPDIQIEGGIITCEEKIRIANDSIPDHPAWKELEYWRKFKVGNTSTVKNVSETIYRIIEFLYMEAMATQPQG